MRRVCTTDDVWTRSAGSSVSVTTATPEHAARVRYTASTNHEAFALVIPAKARDYVFTGVGLSVCLSVCLFVTTITK